MKFVLASMLAAAVSLAQTWVAQTSGTAASLRGVSAVNANVVWASGTEGVWLETIDGGITWKSGHVPGAENLDFRGVFGLDDRTAFLMSNGPGEKSRIYKTTDTGRSWTLLLTNPDSDGFFDAIAFWDSEHGIVVGDPVGGRVTILTTADGGHNWSRREGPAALSKEGLFAASNSCLVIRGAQDAWFATGGPGSARVVRSADGGVTWTVATTPMRKGAASAGIFSLAFSGKERGIAVGGDYAHEQESEGNIAFTSDGGRTWTAPEHDAGRPSGYRSSIVYLADVQQWLTSGTSGSDISIDGGKTWKKFDEGALHAISAISSQAAWVVGPKGRIAKLQMK